MNRVRDRGDSVAWQEFYDLYCPLIFRYGRQRGLRRDDCDELVGACFEKLTRVIADFEYQPSRGKFKSWLKTVVCHQISDMFRQRREDLLPGSDLERHAPADSPQEALWDRAWRDQVLEHAVAQARSLVTAQHFQVFQLNVLEGWSPERIAEAFGLTADQVYRIKYKVLQIVREQMAPYLEP